MILKNKSVCLAYLLKNISIFLSLDQQKRKKEKNIIKKKHQLKNVVLHKDISYIYIYIYIYRMSQYTWDPCDS